MVGGMAEKKSWCSVGSCRATQSFHNLLYVHDIEFLSDVRISEARDQVSSSDAARIQPNSAAESKFEVTETPA